jgi:hypothetical protein
MMARTTIRVTTIAWTSLEVAAWKKIEVIAAEEVCELWFERSSQHRRNGAFGCQSFVSSSASITRIPLGPRRYVSL